MNDVRKKIVKTLIILRQNEAIPTDWEATPTNRARLKSQLVDGLIKPEVRQ